MGCLRTGTGFRSSPSESCNAKANVRPCALLRDIGHGARHPTSPQGGRGLGRSNHGQMFRRVLANSCVFHALKKVPTTGKPTIQAAAEQLTVDCIKAGLFSMSLTYQLRKVHS